MILSSVLKLGKPQITHILTKNFIAENIEVNATDQYRYLLSRLFRFLPEVTYSFALEKV